MQHSRKDLLRLIETAASGEPCAIPAALPTRRIDPFDDAEGSRVAARLHAINASDARAIKKVEDESLRATATAAHDGIGSSSVTESEATVDVSDHSYPLKAEDDGPKDLATLSPQRVLALGAAGAKTSMAPATPLRDDAASSSATEHDYAIVVSDGSHVEKAEDGSRKVLAMSSPRKLFVPDVLPCHALADHRPSPISASKYSRWLVGVQKQSIASEMRHEKEQRREANRQAAERHRERGAALLLSGRMQQAIDRSRCEGVRQQNHDKGDAVREEFGSMRSHAERAKQEWIEHGRALVLAEKEEQARMREAVSPRLSALHSKSAREKQQHMVSLAKAREAVKDSNYAEAQRVRSEATIAEISQMNAYQRRKALATSKSTEALAWKEERRREQQNHLAKARANRAAIEESRRKIKEQRIMLEEQRRAASAEARAQHQQLIAASMRSVSQSVEASHDAIFRTRYASEQEANEVFNSSLSCILP